MTTDRIRFRPYRGLESDIASIPFTNGYVYFAVDTGRIYLDYDNKRLTMGGNGASLFYADQENVAEDPYEPVWVIQQDAITGDPTSINVEDLIINTDGSFYKVQQIVDDTFWCTRLAVSGTGGGGGGGTIISVADITLSIDSDTLASQQTLIQGKEHKVAIRATSDTDPYVTLSFSFTGVNGYTESFAERATSGELFELDLSFLPANSNITMTVQATADNSRMADGVRKRVTGLKVVEMGIEKVSTSSYIPAIIKSENLQGLNLNYIPIGDSSLTESLHVYVDGQEITNEITNSTKTLTRDHFGSIVSVNIPNQEHGTHIVELAVSTVLNRQELYSDRISFEAAWVDSDNDIPIIWLGDTETTVINYESAIIPFMIFNPEDYRAGNRASTIHLFKNGLEISQMEVSYSDSGWINWDISAIYEVGNNLFAIQNGISSKEITIEVTTQGSRNLGLVQENTLLVNLSSAGRSSAELLANREQWKDNKHTSAILTNFNWANNGWVSPSPSEADYANGSYLAIANGAEVTVPMTSLSLNGTNDYSFEVRFRVKNVQKYSTLVTTIPRYYYIDDEGHQHNTPRDSLVESEITRLGYTILRDEWGNKMMDEDNNEKIVNIESGVVCKWLNNNGEGFVIGTQEAYFKTPAQLVSVRYKEEEVINLAFVVSKTEHLVYIYLNGIVSGAVALPINADGTPDPFVINSNLTFNSIYADFDLYRVRVYQYGLTMPDVIHNYLSDLHSIALYDQNQLTKATKPTALDYEKLVAYNEEHPDEPTMPYAVWEINTASRNEKLPYFKGDKCSSTITFINAPADSALDRGEIDEWYYYTHCPSFRAVGVEINVQGTSSQGYPRRNYKTKIKGAETWVFLKGSLAGQEMTETYEVQDAEGNTHTLNPRFHMDNEFIGTNKFTWKIDYMESSGSYNTGFANLMGNLQHPLYTKHPLDDINVNAEGMRTTVYGFPVLTFHKYANSANNPTDKNSEYEYIGRYNINLDKGSNEYFGFESKAAQAYMEGTPTIKSIAECWELSDNQGTWCSFKFPNDAAREVGFGYRQGTTGEAADRLEMMLHFEYRYSPFGDQLDAIGADGKYDGTTSKEAIKAEIGETDLAKSAYVRSKYINLEKLFFWLDSTDTTAATDGTIYIRTPVLQQDGSVTINKQQVGSVQYVTSVDYSGTNGASSIQQGETYLTTFRRDTAQYRTEKFRHEFAQHFDKEYCAVYFIMTELLLCYDSRGKNMMLASYGPHEIDGDYIWYPIFYDIDTQLGLNNSGAYLWDYDADVTKDGLFSTPTSVLWTNFYSVFETDIKNKYRALRGLDDKTKVVNNLTYENIAGAYECDGEVFNSYAMRGLRPTIAIGLDEYYKYFATTAASGVGYFNTSGALVKEASPTYAYACQGDKILTTELLLRNRLNYIDSWWQGGDYYITQVKASELQLRVSGNRAVLTSDHYLNLSDAEILARRNSGSETADQYNGFVHADYPKAYFDARPGYTLKPFLKQYVTYFTDEVPSEPVKYLATPLQENGVRTAVSASTETAYQNTPETPNEQLNYIPGLDYLSSLGDLSTSYISEFSLRKGKRLLDLILGSDIPGYFNDMINENTIFGLYGGAADTGKKPLLKKVVMTNLRTFAKAIDLSGSAKLEEFRALGTQLPGVIFAAGAPIHTLHLPKTVTTLDLIEANNLTRILTTTPVILDYDENAEEPVTYRDASTYSGLYIDEITNATSVQVGRGCALGKLSIIGGNLGYDSYKLVTRLWNIKNGASTNNALRLQLNKVVWTPFAVVPYGTAYNSNITYWLLNDHSTYESYTYSSETWDEYTLNEKIFTRDMSIDSSVITSLELLNNLMDDYEGENHFTNTLGLNNKTVPAITGQMYIENDAAHPIDEAELATTYREKWPDLVIRAAYIAESYIAKFVQILDSGKEDEVHIDRYTKSGTVHPTVTSKIPSKQYYDFKGWAYDKAGTNMFATFDSTTRTCTIVNEATFNTTNSVIVFYAIFENHPYNLTYYDKDGTTVIDVTHVTYGQQALAPASIPLTDESELPLESTYRFVGYSQTLITPEQVTPRILEQSIVDLSKINVTRDMTFYAVFKLQSVYDAPTDANLFMSASGIQSYVDAADPTYNIAGVYLAPKNPNSLTGKITIPSTFEGSPVIGLTGFTNTQPGITHIFFMDHGSNMREFSRQCFDNLSATNPTNLQYIEWPASTRVIDAQAFRFQKALKLTTNFNNMIHLYKLGQNALQGAFGSYANDLINIHFPGCLAVVNTNSFSNFGSSNNTDEHSKINSITITIGGPGDPTHLDIYTQNTVHWIDQSSTIWSGLTVYASGDLYNRLSRDNLEDIVNAPTGHFINTMRNNTVVTDWLRDGQAHRIETVTLLNADA